MVNRPILHNIRILDFTWVLAGPYATRLLADFGAEVIKVQPLMSSEADDGFARGYYDTWNRNKLGINLNLSLQEGIETAKRLISISDVVVENFTPRVMSNWGLDYENLRKIKPEIIMLSMSAMGQTGPHRDYTGFGPTVQAFSGITGLTSFPGQPPTGPGFSYADHVAGLYASLAVLGALEYRRRTGEGQYIDVSQTEAILSLIGDAVLECTSGGREILPESNGSSDAVPHNVYRCQGDDSYCAVAVFTEEEWNGFKQALGSPAWIGKEEFDTFSGRLKNREELDRLVQSWTKDHTADEVMSLLQEHGVAAGVVRNATGIVNDPQLQARGFFVRLDHPETGKTIADATPIKMSDSGAEYKRAAPAPGQDNDYVYGRLLGLSSDEMSSLGRDGVI